MTEQVITDSNKRELLVLFTKITRTSTVIAIQERPAGHTRGEIRAVRGGQQPAPARGDGN
jgi:hypothetical protein